MLHIEERPCGDVMVLELIGNIAAGPAEIQLGDRIRQVLFRGYRKLLLDLAGAASSDASGVSAFLAASSDARSVGAEIKLLHVTSRMSNLLIIVALHRYFSVFDNQEDALDSFDIERPSRPAAGRSAHRRLRPAMAS